MHWAGVAFLGSGSWVRAWLSWRRSGKKRGAGAAQEQVTLAHFLPPLSGISVLSFSHALHHLQCFGASLEAGNTVRTAWPHLPGDRNQTLLEGFWSLTPGSRSGFDSHKWQQRNDCQTKRAHPWGIWALLAHGWKEILWLPNQEWKTFKCLELRNTFYNIMLGPEKRT